MKLLAGPRALLAVLGNRNFSTYTAGNAVSLIGTWMYRLAAGWLAWELTQSPAWLGLIAFSDLFPTVIISPFAGAAADRWDRIKLMQGTVLVASLVSLTLSILVLLDLITIELLLVSTFLLGSAAAFNQPARLALISSLVARPDLNAAVAVNSLVFNLARFVGPVLAAALIATVGVEYAFGANALSALVLLAALSRIRLKPRPRETGPATGMLRQLGEGYVYVARHRGVAAVFVLLVAASLGGRPIVELLPGFAADVFRTDAGGLAAMTAAIGLGAIVGGLTLGVAAEPAILIRQLIVSTLSLAVATMLFTATDIFAFGLATLVLAGFGHARTGITAQTLIQLSVEENKRGRLLALYGMVFRGGPAIGALTMGFASEGIGLRLALLSGGIMMSGVWFWAFAMRKRIARSFH